MLIILRCSKVYRNMLGGPIFDARRFYECPGAIWNLDFGKILDLQWCSLYKHVMGFRLDWSKIFKIMVLHDEEGVRKKLGHS